MLFRSAGLPKGRRKGGLRTARNPRPASRHPQQEGVSGAASAVRSPSRGTVRRAAADTAEPSRAEPPGPLRPEAGGRRGAARPGTQAIAPGRGAASRPTGARRHATERAAEQSRGANPRPAPTACRCRAPTVVQPTSRSKDKWKFSLFSRDVAPGIQFERKPRIVQSSWLMGELVCTMHQPRWTRPARHTSTMPT